MTRDPQSAPPRPDLVFLRHRSLRPARPAPEQLAEFVAGHAHHPDHHPTRAPVPPVATPTAARSSLDLDEPPAKASAAPAAPTAPTAPTASSSLDLDDVRATPRSTPLAPPVGPVVRRPPVTRAAATGRLVLDAGTPSVTLTRVQSGIGTLTVDAACSADVGDLRLGCAYRLHDGTTSVISTVGERIAPAGSRHPVLLATREEFQRISVDLRDVRDVERFMVYAFSDSRTNLHWGGTVLVSTHAGARIEAPLIGLDTGSVGVLLSGYQNDGELSLWTEMLAGTSVRDACRAFGFDDITWLDDRTPVS